MNTRTWLLMLLAASVPVGAALAARPSRHRHARRGIIQRLARDRSVSGKPTAPITFALVPGAIVGSGRQQVRVVVTPGIAAVRVELTVRASDGLGLLAGPAYSNLPGSAGQPSHQDLLLGVTGSGERRLVIVATLVLPDGSRQSGVDGYRFNPLPHTPQSDFPGSRVITERSGRRILQIPAASR